MAGDARVRGKLGDDGGSHWAWVKPSLLMGAGSFLEAVPTTSAGDSENLTKCFLQHDQGKQLSGTGIIKTKMHLFSFLHWGGKTGRAHHGILVLHE